MPVRIRVTRAARAEMRAARDWYREISPSLGRRFQAALLKGQERISDNPMRFPVVEGDVRRALLLDGFPYALFFRVHEDVVLVVACFHLSRDPQVWQAR